MITNEQLNERIRQLEQQIAETPEQRQRSALAQQEQDYLRKLERVCAEIAGSWPRYDKWLRNHVAYERERGERHAKRLRREGRTAEYQKQLRKLENLPAIVAEELISNDLPKPVILRPSNASGRVIEHVEQRKAALTKVRQERLNDLVAELLRKAQA